MPVNQNQTWNPDQYAENARFVAELGMPVVELLAPKPGERILDLGCGDGPLTRKLADLGCNVVGVDGSPEMIEAAKKLGLDARVMDGQALVFENEFDAVFSNAALHWMKQPEKVIEGVWRALRHGGQFVAECGGKGNVNTILEALRSGLSRRGIDPEPYNPWVFLDADEYRALLEKQGFRVNTIALIPRPTLLPGDVIGWLETFGKSFAAALPHLERAAYLEEVAAACRPTFCNEKGECIADYVRLRFSAVKP